MKILTFLIVFPFLLTPLFSRDSVSPEKIEESKKLSALCYDKNSGDACHLLGDIYAFSFSPEEKFYDAAEAYMRGCELKYMPSCEVISELVWTLGFNSARAQESINY